LTTATTYEGSKAATNGGGVEESCHGKTHT